MEPESSDKRDKREVLRRIPAGTRSFEFTKKELETILEQEFPTVRRMTLGLNSPSILPFLHARATVERQQREFTNGWDPFGHWIIGSGIFPHV